MGVEVGGQGGQGHLCGSLSWCHIVPPHRHTCLVRFDIFAVHSCCVCLAQFPALHELISWLLEGFFFIFTRLEQPTTVGTLEISLLCFISHMQHRCCAFNKLSNCARLFIRCELKSLFLNEENAGLQVQVLSESPWVSCSHGRGNKRCSMWHRGL